MIQRCCNPKATGFFRYGKKGIAVCERWKSFTNFLADMGERPDGKTLDRINPQGNYEPMNCKWSTPKEQAAHMSRNIHITIGGETLILREWCRRLGVNRETLRYRYNHGMWPK
jgi:hypothetical protein